MSQPANGTPLDRKPRILIADDDAFLLRSVARLQRLYGHLVVCATGGAEALDALSRDLDFDLVIFDMDMPPVHGPEFLATALARHPELRGRLVVASGNIDEHVRALAANGACRVLPKPYTPTEVDALLKSR
jgi:DNA-binding NtrC family response regulator